MTVPNVKPISKRPEITRPTRVNRPSRISMPAVTSPNADFYAIVNINGREENNKDSNISDQDDISPNWQFSRPVDTALGSVPVSL